MKKLRTFNWFTLIELLVTISIIMILSAVLLPALNVAKEKARSIECMDKLKQNGTCVLMYSSDYQGFIPISPGAPGYWHMAIVKNGYTSLSYETWAATLSPIGQFKCPSETDPYTVGGGVWARTHYGQDYLMSVLNLPPEGLNIIKYPKPSQKVFVGDSGGSLANGFYISPYPDYYPKKRHNNNWNQLYLDGHVGSRKDIPPASSSFWLKDY